MGKGLADQPIGIEIHLPVVGIVAIRAHSEHRAGEIKGQDLYIGRGLIEDVRDFRQRGLEKFDGGLRIDAVGQLSCEFDAPVLG